MFLFKEIMNYKTLLKQLGEIYSLYESKAKINLKIKDNISLNWNFYVSTKYLTAGKMRLNWRKNLITVDCDHSTFFPFAFVIDIKNLSEGEKLSSLDGDGDGVNRK